MHGPRRKMMKGEPPSEPQKIKRKEQFKIIPRKNVRIKLCFKNFMLRYRFTREFQEKSVLGQEIYQTQVEISMYSPNSEPIYQFLRYIQNEYDQDQKKQEWQLKIHTIETSQRDSQLSWAERNSNYSKYWDTVALDINQKQMLRQDIETFIGSKGRYQRVGVPYQRGYLFYGKAGCGKSSLIRCIACEYKL